jgi:hypothetical protein
MFIKDQLNRTARRIAMAYSILGLTLLVGLAEVPLLALSGVDPMTAVTLPWKLWAMNLLLVLAFAGRYLRPYLLTLLEPAPEPQPISILSPLEIEKERIERWAKRGW